MHVTQEDGQYLRFDVYPPFYHLFPTLLTLCAIVFSLFIDDFLIKIPAFCISCIFFTEMILYYLKPLHIEIDKVSQNIYYRDLHIIIPNLLIKDDNKDEYASFNPFRKFSIKGLTKLSFTKYKRGKQGDLLNLYPLRRLSGGNFSFHFADGEKIDMYVDRSNLRRHLRAFHKITAYLAVPFEETK